MRVSSLKILPLRQALNISLAIVGLSLASQCAIPFYPIPLTLQTMAVMAVALSLAPGQATLSTLAWITSGAMGAPVFAGFCGGPGILCGPRGGYLWGMLVASFVMSWLRFKVWPKVSFSEKNSKKEKVSVPPFLFLGVIALIGDSLVFVLGWAQLQFLLGDGYRAWTAGVAPFIVGECIKILIVSTGLYYFHKSRPSYGSSPY